MLAKMSASLLWSTRLLLLAIESLPRFAVQPLGQFLATLYRFAAPRKMRRAQTNLAIALGDQLDDAEISRLARASLNHQAVSLLETVRELRRPGAVTFSGVKEFNIRALDLEQGGAGQLLITAHIGAWEFINRAGTQAATGSFYALAKEPKQPAANRLLDALRESAGMEVFPSGRKSTLRRMLRVLQQGGWIGLAMDQKPDGPGVPVQFFGRTTEFVVGPAALVERQGCRVLVAFSVREGNSAYRILSEKLEIEPGESRQDLTQKMADTVERVIRQYPEQWLWTYRRWPDVR